MVHGYHLKKELRLVAFHVEQPVMFLPKAKAMSTKLYDPSQKHAYVKLSNHSQNDFILYIS